MPHEDRLSRIELVLEKQQQMFFVANLLSHLGHFG
jgi:hypothetical protein